LEQNLAIAESFTPMTDEERLAFFQDIIHLVRPDKMPWKASWSRNRWVSPSKQGKVLGSIHAIGLLTCRGSGGHLWMESR
jgi:hypothetical protein